MTKEHIEYINGKIEDLKEELRELEEQEESEELDDLLNDSYGYITICGINFYPSEILKECDPIAYHQELMAYNDSKITELNEEIEQLEQELKEVE